MSMTKDAIQHLEQTALLADVNKALGKVATVAPIVALPDGVQLSDLEKAYGAPHLLPL